MANLRLPLWFVFARPSKVPSTQPPCNDARATLAFSVPENLTAFLQARKGERWKLELAYDPRELSLMLANLHQRGESSVCLNQEPDGSGGEKVALDQLLAFCESLPKD